MRLVKKKAWAGNITYSNLYVFRTEKEAWFCVNNSKLICKSYAGMYNDTHNYTEALYSEIKSFNCFTAKHISWNGDAFYLLEMVITF